MGTKQRDPAGGEEESVKRERGAEKRNQMKRQDWSDLLTDAHSVQRAKPRCGHSPKTGKREGLNTRTRYVLNLTCWGKVDAPSQAALPGGWRHTGAPRLSRLRKRALEQPRLQGAGTVYSEVRSAPLPQSAWRCFPGTALQGTASSFEGPFKIRGAYQLNGHRKPRAEVRGLAHSKTRHPFPPCSP